MLKNVLFILTIIISGYAYDVLAQPLSDRLKQGDQAIGFKLIDTYDYGRTYLLEGAEDQYGPRPLQIAVWYPAGKPVEGTSPMTFGDYAFLIATEEILGEPTEKQKQAVRREYGSFAGSEDALEKLFGAPMHATKNGKARSGAFPLILYGPSQNGSAYDNALLCEYIASHGYIVASVASKGAYHHKMPFNSEGAEAQARDLEFTAGVMYNFPNVKSEKIGVVGFSFGGLSNTIFALRHANVAAVVSFDGSIGSDLGYDIIASYPYMKSNDLRSAFLHFGGNKFKLKLGSFKFYDDLAFSDAYVMTLKGLNHLQFSSFNIMFRAQPEYAYAGYAAMCDFSVSFLDHYVKKDTPSFEQVAAAYQRDIFSQYDHKIGKEPPPSKEAFIRLIQTQGIDKGVATYHAVKQAYPTYDLFEFQAFRDVGWLYMQDGQHEEAVKAFEILMDAYPDTQESFRRLGEAHMVNGDREIALTLLRKALEMKPDDPAVKQILQRMENK